ncbi:hypothetical protein CDAR_456401 [Caerostris darwini]|uniref:Uncharacterized protein n=1 Tax=Caerostris darwini TaxID=1538125 RepID=A0AAV4UNH6_9ARAC|nr:hypothetical protein CDAR_456401 [Caerostris darwini]
MKCQNSRHQRIIGGEKEWKDWNSLICRNPHEDIFLANNSRLGGNGTSAAYMRYWAWWKVFRQTSMFDADSRHPKRYPISHLKNVPIRHKAHVRAIHLYRIGTEIAPYGSHHGLNGVSE